MKKKGEMLHSLIANSNVNHHFARPLVSHDPSHFQGMTRLQVLRLLGLLAGGLFRGDVLLLGLLALPRPEVPIGQRGPYVDRFEGAPQGSGQQGQVGGMGPPPPLPRRGNGNPI